MVLTGVTKRFGEVTAVEAMDLEIRDGEFFSLLGPSGCGKTTTLRMIAGFEFPTEGSVRIKGKEMGLEPPNRRPVNTVFQSYALFPHMTVAENVGFGLKMTGVGRTEIAERVARALDQVQLAHRADARPSQLSGGQQQRVALARALVNQPAVLLLDEPLGALDLKLRQAMQVELKELQERVGITFIYVTHDQEEALTMSDRIGVMNAGRLLQVGAPEAIYEHPTSRFVADFIGDINLVAAICLGSGRVSFGDGAEAAVPGVGAAGEKVTVALRPERLHLTSPGGDVPAGANRVRGTVQRRVYHGDGFSYEVTVAGVTLKVRQENTPGLARFEAGADVEVFWDPSAANLVED